MESPLLGLILDSSVIIAAERKRQTVEDLLVFVGQTFGEIEIAISAVTLAELVHGVVRANTSERRENRRAFIDELKKHVPVHPITDSTAEIAGQIGGEQAAKGITLPADDLLIGASAIEQGYAAAARKTSHFQKISCVPDDLLDTQEVTDSGSVGPTTFSIKEGKTSPKPLSFPAAPRSSVAGARCGPWRPPR
jgi:predicted nucleic acid-binding protein